MLWATLGLAALATDAPEISRSTGQTGGFVVLWPRVVPATTDPTITAVAHALQARLRALATTAAPTAPLDVRPAPERVCPRQGCQGVALGAVLYHQEGACVAAVTVSPPGPSPARLAPWGGLLTLKGTEVPFREPPEGQLAVRDFVSCSGLLVATEAGDPGVLALISSSR